MAVFYAYITNVDDDNTWRHVLVFQDSATADEWWRAVSGSGNVLLNDIKRIAPQLYLHKPAVFNIFNFFVDTRITDIASPFRGRLIITLENDRGGRGLSIIFPQDVTDLASGNWFYVRSKVNQNVYWYYDPQTNSVKTSTTRRTLFQVTAKGLAANTIIIGTDNVTLTVAPQLNIGIDNVGNLIGGPSWNFIFSDLARGRFVGGNDQGVIFENVDDSAPRKEGWELVN